MELTKEYFNEQLKRLATKQDLESLATKEEIVALHDDVAGLKADITEIKETVARIDERDIEDSNAFARDIVQLQKDVKELKFKHAS